MVDFNFVLEFGFAVGGDFLNPDFFLEIKEIEFLRRRAGMRYNKHFRFGLAVNVAHTRIVPERDPEASLIERDERRFDFGNFVGQPVHQFGRFVTDEFLADMQVPS